ncbi:MAG: hypothetical protein HY244_03350 [Rhizobiales bacterium]|nr:hypothetical protein [Hyphomicrobiales bacterium]
MGMLSTAAAGNDGSLKSFLRNSNSAANAFATISQSSVTNASALIAQMAAQNLQKANDKKMQEAFAALSAQQKMVPKKNVLDPIIYFPDGSTIDTVNNIMTRVNGTQYDTITGAIYVDPASIIQMANGAYLNTKTNILTMPDGTRIDTVTGLKVSTTA